jgi:UDP-N-acetylglucosamine:LPS N-acetylglucosamine transferase
MSEKKKVYMAIADTGGGHRAAARSLTGAYDLMFDGKYDIMIDNVFTNTKSIGKKLENAYAALNNRFTFIYSMGYVLTSIKPILYLVNNIMGVNSIPKTTEKLREFNPDIVVSIHPLVDLILKKSIKKAGINPKMAVVITDPITAHIGWFNPKIYDLYIVSSNRLKNKLLKHGVKEDKIKIYDPPLNPQFQKSLSENEISNIKERFDFPKDKKIIFFAGSGEGFKNIDKYIKRILNKPKLMEKAYFVVVTGKNTAQKEMLERLTKNHENNFKIFGFSKDMHDLTAASDLIICKAGPATTYQALILKTPIIHTMYIYGQEKGNTELIKENNYGRYIPNIKKLVDKIEDLVLHEEKLNEMKNNLEHANFTNGSESIVRELHNLLNSGA